MHGLVNAFEVRNRMLDIVFRAFVVDMMDGMGPVHMVLNVGMGESVFGCHQINLSTVIETAAAPAVAVLPVLEGV